MPGGEAIRISGLKEFRRGLKSLDARLPREIRKAGNVAAKIVVDSARPRVPIGPGRGGHAASSIKAASSQTSVRVSEGGARFPYMPWLDFGGTINKHTGTPSTRPFIREGRYVWAAFADHKAEVERAYLDALHDAAESAGLDPH